MDLKTTLLLFIKLVLACAARVHHEQIKEAIPIGGIFNSESSVPAIAFRAALERSSLFSTQFNFVPEIRVADFGDSYSAKKAACNLTATGVVAILAPQNQRSAIGVQSVGENFHMPIATAAWTTPANPRSISPQYTLDFHPDPVSLSSALAALIEDYDWKEFTILYEDDYGFVRLQEVLKRGGARVRRLEIGGDNRALFKSLYAARVTYMVLDCHVSRIKMYLEQAQEVGMFEDYQSYLLSSLDAHTLDWGSLKYSLANVTCLRMVDPQAGDSSTVIYEWRRLQHRTDIPSSIEQVDLETALAADVATHMAKALHELQDTMTVEAKPFTCSEKYIWGDGYEILAYMRTMTSHGLTGSIEFNEHGRRVNFQLTAVELSKHGFTDMATWSLKDGLKLTRTTGQTSQMLAEKWQDKTFIVASRIGAPYLSWKKPQPGEVLTGNDRFEGYCMDLIAGVAKILKFSFSFELVPDGKYGAYNKETKTWDGLVKQLLDRKADLAVCDLTMTYERRSAVDFTMPFMTLGISILYSKTTKQPPDLLSFMEPLSIEVWIYMASAYLSVSILLVIVARLCPSDWENPHPCNKEPDELENIWTLKNCCWLTMGCMMTQGSDILPKGVSTRWLCGMWWFFVLIMASSYTANLAAFLTNERMDVTISSAEDLAKQNKIKYGAVAGGSTAGFFASSNVSTYKRMWATMQSTRPSVFCRSNDEGVERVSKGKRQYAFLMESTGIDYVIERHCDLTQIGGLLDSKGYGIAMPVNSPYRKDISQAVLKMAEAGQLVELKQKWWKEMHGGGGCDDDESTSDSEGLDLGLENVGGVFIVLGCGCACGVLVAIIEFLWHVREVAVEQNMTQTEALVAELVFAFSFWERSKPVHHSQAGSSKSSKSSSRSSHDRDTEKLEVPQENEVHRNRQESATMVMTLETHNV